MVFLKALFFLQLSWQQVLKRSSPLALQLHLDTSPPARLHLEILRRNKYSFLSQEFC